MPAAAQQRRDNVAPLPARRPRRLRDSVAGPIGTRPVTQLAPDADSREWLATLRSSDPRTHAEAVGRLHELLLRAARFEVRRRSAAARHVGREQLDDIAHQSAHDALVAVLAKLDSYRGESRFTTWAYKFALLEAGVKMRRRAWNEREVTLASEGWPAFADPGPSPHHDAQMAELLGAIGEAIADRPDAPPARGARRHHPRRRADRRPRRAPADHARRALQDPARRAPAPALVPGRARPEPRPPRPRDLAMSPDRRICSSACAASSARAGPELTCEECFEHLDHHVELVLAGADAEAAVPGMAAHLEGCPACAEDHESLMALVSGETGPGADEFHRARGSLAQHSTPRRTS